MGNPPPIPPPLPETGFRPFAPQPPRPPRSTWPTVIGIIGLAFGSISILSLPAFYAMESFQEFMESVVTPASEQPEPDPYEPQYGPGPHIRQDEEPQPTEQPWTFPEQPEWYQSYLWYQSFVTTMLGVVLVIGSGLLLKRRRPAGQVLILYAIPALLLQIVGVGINAMYMSRVTESLPENSPLDPSSMSMAIWVSLPFSIAGPAFVLIWFLRPSIRKQIARWK